MYKKMFFLLFTIIVYLFLNLGNFMDVTKKAQKSDIIVSLGGDHYGSRIKKATSLYKEGFSTSGLLLYTGPDDLHNDFKEFRSKKQYFLDQKIKDKNTLHIERITNTMEELFFIKKYMLYNNYKSVIFISHPHHSRRIETLANIIAGYKENGLTLSIVSSNPLWWEKDKYYTNKTSLTAASLESVKLVYNLIKYNPLLIKYTSYSKRNKEKLWDNILKNNNYSVKYD